MSPTKIAQNNLHEVCLRKFSDLIIINEWRAFRGRSFQYSPCVDIAFGPFNNGLIDNQKLVYNDLVERSDVNTFLKGIYKYHKQNVSELNNEIIVSEFDRLIFKNLNSRCLLAIEIENTNSKKHMMGSIVNASSLGRVGIGIAFNKSALKTFLRNVNYLQFLTRVNKNSYDTTNFLVVSLEQINSLFD